MTADLPRFEALDAATCVELRARLLAARYDDEILAWAESIAPGAPDAVRLPVVHWNLRRRSDPIAKAALLFAYEAPLDRAEADELLGAALVDRLVAARVLVIEGGAVRSLVRLAPIADLFMLGDVPTQGPDVVMPPGPTTLEILRLFPAAVHGAVLDVGCGPGAFALMARRRGASRVVGVDISPRALDAARACARLNELDCEYAVGDLTAPVRGQRFDFVFAQPPYVVRPPDAEQVTFLHGGAAGDEIAMRLLGELPAVLAPGGQAQVLFDTPVRKGEPLHARVRAALGDAPLDVVILASRGLAPDVQACGYASLEVPALGPGYAKLVERYREHLASVGVEATTHALVLLRLPREASGAPVTVTLPMNRLPRGDAVVAGLWAALDLASASDDALEAARLRVSPHARWIEERASLSADAPITRKVQFAEGSFGTEQEVSDAAVALFEAVEDAATVRDAIARYAEVCEATVVEVRADALGFLRQALAHGILVPG